MQDQNGANDAGQTSVGTENFIEIAQADCSFARYGILKKNSALVKPGQTVKAGQPIGLVGGDSYGRGSDLRFSVYYYQEENTAAETGSRHYIITQIWTKNNGRGRLRQGVFYISEFPKAVLNQETLVPAPKKQGKVKNLCIENLLKKSFLIFIFRYTPAGVWFQKPGPRYRVPGSRLPYWRRVSIHQEEDNNKPGSGRHTR